jgi:predicted nucleic acid-binding protein
MVTHPRPNTAIAEWLKDLLAAGVTVLVPEIADYEVRRELLRAGKATGVERLDKLKEIIGYLPITTDAMLIAADFWAQARTGGYPTASDDSLDADAILAGQAKTIANHDDGPVIATTNVGHLSRFTAADNWENIQG